MNNDDDDIVVECPHCHDFIIVRHSDIKCRIFRHAVWKDTMVPIDPHATKEACDQLVTQNQVLGCGKPFELVPSEEDGGGGGASQFIAVPCAYK